MGEVHSFLGDEIFVHIKPEIKSPDLGNLTTVFSHPKHFFNLEGTTGFQYCLHEAFPLPGVVYSLAYGACHTVHLVYTPSQELRKKRSCFEKSKPRAIASFSVDSPIQLLQALRRTSRDCVLVTPRLWS